MWHVLEIVHSTPPLVAFVFVNQAFQESGIGLAIKTGDNTFEQSTVLGYVFEKCMGNINFGAYST